MGLVRYLVVVLTLSAQLVFTSPLVEKTCYINGKECKMCPAGKYQSSCAECLPCSAGSFTSDWNCEDSCHHCFRDCRSDYDLKVVQNCTSTSNIRCVCKTGFTCTQKVSLTENCASCVKIQQTTTTAPGRTAELRSGNDKQTPSSISLAHRRTSAKPCPLSKCVPPTPSTDVKDSQLAAILCPVVVVGCVALVILFCVRQPGDETCFKRAFAKLRNEGRRASSSSSYKSKESTHQFPRESFSAKQQPPSLAAANLGPVHVHNPGTVIFSLLSQFTGQVGATTVGGKTAERVVSEEDDERDSSPVCHPTTSPSVHLSEEERSGDIDSIFFPSQEQGKDCHVSKEEEL